MKGKQFSAVWVLLLLAWLLPSPVFGEDQGEVLVERVEIQGARRFPRETILYYIQTREGDIFNQAQLERDLKSLWAQNLFKNIEVLSRDGELGGKVVIFRVQENPIIRDLQFKGIKSVSESDILLRFREKRVGVSKEEMWDPAKGHNARKVLADLLSEKGHPDAEIEIESEELSSAAVGVTFQVKEGPRVRVLKIEFDGNNIFSDDELRKGMKNVRESGFITRFSSRDIYHPLALQDDIRRVEFTVLWDQGYLEAQIGQPRVEEMTRGAGFLIFPFRIPLISPPKQGLRLVIPISEGRQFRFGKIEIEGNTVFNDEQIKAFIGLKTDEVYRSTVIQKGVFENLRDLYGRLGYIEMIAEPRPELRDDPADPSKGIADLTITVQEGRQYTLRFIEFVGNTTTREKVLRREVLTPEGEIFDQLLWKQSLLRLNQLGFFEEVKEEDAQLKPNDRTGLLDIDLRVTEKGRNQINFTGGASGIGGSFFGLEYSTNNLLGYGESLSFSFVSGNRQRFVAFSFTEPYLFDRSISLGFSVSHQSLDFFDQGFGAIPAGNLSFFGFNLDRNSLFQQKSTGFSVFTSTSMTTLTKRWLNFGRWARIGLSYSFNSTRIKDPPVNTDANPDNDIPVTFTQPPILTSTVVPSLFYNTLNHPLDPTSGQSFALSLGFTGSVLGGDVNLVQPSVEYKRFFPMRWQVRGKPTVVGFRALAAHLAPFGERFQSNSLSFIGGTPIFSRFYLGGEETIRGYNIRSIAPVARVSQRLTTTEVQAIPDTEFDTLGTNQVLPVLRDSDAPLLTPFVRKSVIDAFTFTDRLTNISLVPIGGDTELLFNLEYRIPIAGPLTIALFGDVGSAFNVRRYNNETLQFAPRLEVVSPLFLSGNEEFTSVVLGPFGGVLINPDGTFATQQELEFARLAQGGGAALVPNGYSNVLIRGLADRKSDVFLSETESGIRAIDNYRASLGIELRFQLPVVQVPFRLIYAYNPNARVIPGPLQIFREERTVFRFSVGRTF